MTQVIDENFYQEQLFQERKESLDLIKKESVIKEVFKEDDEENFILARFIIIVAVIGDLLGLIPIMGSVFSFLFIVLLVVLYVFEGLGNGILNNSFERKIRKTLTAWVLRTLVYSVEIIIPGGSFLPILTIEALIHFNLRKRNIYKKIRKTEEIIKDL